RAAELAPSPRILFEWALAESERGDDRKAQSLLQRVVAAQPDMIPAWLGLAIASYQIGDTAECRRAALRALEIQPDLERARALLRSIAPRESTHVPRAR
ncbi:MAG TPA: tetratricopeptide repeat protein, partial [Anaeromyxobacter sp.]